MRRDWTTFLYWTTWIRFVPVRKLAWQLIGSEGSVFVPPKSALRLLFGGDVSFDPKLRMMSNLGLYRLREKTVKGSIFTRMRRKLWRKFCIHFFSPQFFHMKINEVFDEFTMEKPQDNKLTPRNTYYYNSENIVDDQLPTLAKYSYPFEKIAPLLKSKDLVFVNLETPLSTHPRPNGLFISDPQYAQAMKDVGISITAVANNHIFDAGEIGLVDTLCHLKSAGIRSVGAGENLEKARKGHLVQLRDTRLLFLGYTQFCNGRFASLAGDYPGILPLDRKLMIDDIKQARPKADVLFISLHWGLENQPNVRPEQVEIAHQLIEAGADCIIGHHPHVPHGIEIYKSKPIFYSLGNFIFPRFYVEWSDNFLAETIIVQGRITGIILYPIAGKGRKLFQPELLTGDRADSFLHELRLKSIVFNTAIAIRDHLGYIDLS